MKNTQILRVHFHKYWQCNQHSSEDKQNFHHPESTLMFLSGLPPPTPKRQPLGETTFHKMEGERPRTNFGRLKLTCRASLVVQWLRIHLPMQGIWVRSLVREDPTCRGATKPMHHNYWACALEPASHNYWARVPQLLKPAHWEPVLRSKRSHNNEKPAHHNKD